MRKLLCYFTAFSTMISITTNVVSCSKKSVPKISPPEANMFKLVNTTESITKQIDDVFINNYNDLKNGSIMGENDLNGITVTVKQGSKVVNGDKIPVYDDAYDLKIEVLNNSFYLNTDITAPIEVDGASLPHNAIVDKINDYDWSNFTLTGLNAKGNGDPGEGVSDSRLAGYLLDRVLSSEELSKVVVYDSPLTDGNYSEVSFDVHTDDGKGDVIGIVKKIHWIAYEQNSVIKDQNITTITNINNKYLMGGVATKDGNLTFFFSNDWGASYKTQELPVNHGDSESFIKFFYDGTYINAITNYGEVYQAKYETDYGPDNLPTFEKTKSGIPHNGGNYPRINIVKYNSSTKIMYLNSDEENDPNKGLYEVKFDNSSSTIADHTSTFTKIDVPGGVYDINALSVNNSNKMIYAGTTNDDGVTTIYSFNMDDTTEANTLTLSVPFSKAFHIKVISPIFNTDILFIGGDADFDTEYSQVWLYSLKIGSSDNILDEAAIGQGMCNSIVQGISSNSFILERNIHTNKYGIKNKLELEEVDLTSYAGGKIPINSVTDYGVTGQHYMDHVVDMFAYQKIIYVGGGFTSSSEQNYTGICYFNTRYTY